MQTINCSTVRGSEAFVIFSAMRILPLSFVLARPLAARRARQPVRRPPRFPRHLNATLGRTSLHRPAPSRSPESSVASSTRARRGSRCHPRPLATSPMYRYDLDASSGAGVHFSAQVLQFGLALVHLLYERTHLILQVQNTLGLEEVGVCVD